MEEYIPKTTQKPIQSRIILKFHENVLQYFLGIKQMMFKHLYIINFKNYIFLFCRSYINFKIKIDYFHRRKQKMFNPKLSKINQIRIRTISKSSQKVSSLQKRRLFAKNINKFQVQNIEQKKQVEVLQEVKVNKDQIQNNQNNIPLKKQRKVLLPTVPFSSKQKKNKLSLSRPQSKKQIILKKEQTKVSKQQHQNIIQLRQNQKEQTNINVKAVSSQTTQSQSQFHQTLQLTFQNFQKQTNRQKLTFCQSFNLTVLTTSKKKYTDSDTQTYVFTTQDKQYQEYTRFRLLKAKSMQSVQNYFNYIRELGQKARIQMEQRAKELNKYISEGPKQERQKRVYQLVKSLQKKQNQVDSNIYKIISDQKLKQYNIGLAICKCNGTLQPVFQSIKSLLKIFYTKYQREQKPVYSRIINRIQRHLGHILEKMGATMEKVNSFKSISSPWVQVADAFNNWHLENQQYKRLIRNCVNRILVLPVTSYQLFGNDETLLYQNMQDSSLDPQQKFNRVFQKKCEDCQNVRHKVTTIHKQNNVLKPIIKVLNELVKDVTSPFFKHQLQMTEIPESLPQKSQNIQYQSQSQSVYSSYQI